MPRHYDAILRQRHSKRRQRKDGMKRRAIDD